MEGSGLLYTLLGTSMHVWVLGVRDGVAMCPLQRVQRNPLHTEGLSAADAATFWLVTVLRFFQGPGLALVAPFTLTPLN